MRSFPALLVVLVFFSCQVSGAAWAHCRLDGTAANSGTSGTVTFYQMSPSSLVEMEVHATGITVNPDGPHGIHIHQWGEINVMDGTGTGGHFNPGSQTHGCPSNTSRHLGDTGNWNVVGGTINQTKTLDLLTLYGQNSIIGRAVILHAAEDDCVTDPTGDAGSRLAQCVIGITNQANNEAINQYPNTTKAICTLKGTAGNEHINGTVYFDQTDSGMNIVATFYGLTPGDRHGFHIHAFGDLSMDNGLSLGGHYNPNGAPHRIPDVTPRHVGDLGNVFHFEQNEAQYRYIGNDLITINGGANNVIGRGMVLHADEDDCQGEAGNAGARLATCVIGIRRDSTDAPSLQTPAGQDTSNCATPAPTEPNDNAATGLVASALLMLLCVLF